MATLLKNWSAPLAFDVLTNKPKDPWRSKSSFNQYKTQNIPLFQSGAVRVSLIRFLSPACQWGWLHFYTCLGTYLLWWLLQAQFSSVQSLSHVQLFATPWTAAYQASLSIANSQSLLKLTSIKLVMPSNHLILCHSLLLLPSIFPSIRVYLNELVLHIRWPKYWSFSFSISPSNEYSGLISWIYRKLTGWISLQSKGISRVFSNTTVQKHQFFGTQLSLQSNSYIHTWLLEKP